MAQINFPGLKKYGDALRQLEIAFEHDEILRDAVWAGAQPVADEVRRQIEAIPVGDWKYNGDGQLWITGPTEEARDAMLDGLGIAPPREAEPGSVDTKVGFDGLFGAKTKRHPRGYPVKLEAYRWEHGTSFNAKHPFVRPAVRVTRKQAIAEMEKSIEADLKKIFKE